MAGAVKEQNEKSEVVPEREESAGGANTAGAEKDLVDQVKGLSLAEEKEPTEDSGNAPDMDDKLESYIKHPLQNSWKFWFLHSDTSITNWEERVMPIASFDTVEDFWSVYNHIKTPSEFPTGHDYYLFKNGIKPIWEHEENRSGGKLEVMWERKGNKFGDVDKLWLDSMLLLIGEAFDDADFINGVTCCIRRNDKIAFWLKKDNKDVIKNIETQWKAHLNWSKPKKIAYSKHMQ